MTQPIDAIRVPLPQPVTRRVAAESVKDKILDFIANPNLSNPKTVETLHELSRLQDILYDYRRQNSTTPPAEVYGWKLEKSLRSEDPNLLGKDFLDIHVYRKGDAVVPIVMGAKYTPGEIWREAAHLITSIIPGISTQVPQVWKDGIESLKALKKEYGDSMIPIGHSRGSGIVQAFASQTKSPAVTFGTFPRPDDSILGPHKADAPVANVYVNRAYRTSLWDALLPDKVGKTVLVKQPKDTWLMNSVAAHDMKTIYDTTHALSKKRGNTPIEDVEPIKRPEQPMAIKVLNKVPML